MQPDLNGTSAVVTGAGRGIGAGIARALAGAGARVFLAARTESQLSSVAAQIRGAGGLAEAVPTDLSRPDRIQALFQTVRRRAGGLDILVNNAGVAGFGPVLGFPAAELDRIMNVNVRAVFLCCQEALALMISKGSGAIINIASVVGIRGYRDQGAYSASKHAVMGLTSALAQEVAELGIRVSAVLPGGVDTAMGAEARPDLDRSALLQPEDVAQAVLYLLSLSERAAVDQIVIRRRGARPF